MLFIYRRKNKRSCKVATLSDYLVQTMDLNVYDVLIIIIQLLIVCLSVCLPSLDLSAALSSRFRLNYHPSASSSRTTQVRRVKWGEG